MNILITGHHVDLTPALRAHVEEKLERLSRHFDQVQEIEVILQVEAPSEKERRQRAEINLRLKGDVLHAESSAQDLYAAMDMVVEKMDRQLLRFKGKVQDHRNESIKHISP